MSVLVILKVLAIWLGILFLAVLNGTLREAVLTPKFGTTFGLFLSGVLLSVLIFIVTYFSLPWLDLRRLSELIGIGFSWLILTLFFEFSFGLWQGKSWQVLLNAYTFKDGNIWPVILFITTIAPYIVGKLRGWV